MSVCTQCIGTLTLTLNDAPPTSAISIHVIPSDQISTEKLCGLFAMTSGGINRGVPTMLVVRIVSTLLLLKPKSVSLALPSCVEGEGEREGRGRNGEKERMCVSVSVCMCACVSMLCACERERERHEGGCLRI